MDKRTLLLLFAFTCAFHLSKAQQFEYVAADEINFTVDGEVLSDPFSGGFNAVQVREIDIDVDGATEWIIFDRSNNKAYIGERIEGEILINKGRSESLPPEITNWLIFADYDGDGRPDIFTDTSFGVKVIRNGTSGWEVLDGNLRSLSNGNSVNIVVSGSDFPAIGDFDEDGDVDLLVFDFVSGDRIVLYKNVSADNNLDDPLTFEKADLFWGGVEECNCNDFIFDGSGCDGSRFEKIQHAAAKSIVFNGNDLFIGIEGCPQMAFLPNAKDFNSPDFSSFQTDFFSKTDFGEYTINSFADYDGDGVDDFIVSNNTRTDGFFLDYSQSINVFSGADKTLLTESFMQQNSIDVGEQSYPALFDWDDDGDLDLFIGNKGQLDGETYRATLHYYENTGNFRRPNFTLRDRDFLSLSEREWIRISPTFIDVNEDGRTDLFIGAGKSNQLIADMFLLLRNEDGTFAEPIDWSFRYSRNDLPHIRDLNNDGRLDVILGRNFGRLNVFINNGTNTAPDFEEQSENFLGIDSDGERINPTLAFINLDDDPQEEIIKSDARGVLEVYQDITSDPIVENFLNQEADETGRFDLGFNNPLAFGDLYGTGEIFGMIGDIRGGIKAIRLQSADIPEVLTEFIAFPNPLVDNRTITFYTERSQTLTMHDASGRLISTNLRLIPNEDTTFDLSGLRPGVYFLRGPNNTFRLILQ